MSACNSEKQVRDLLEVTRREHHALGKSLIMVLSLTWCFTDKPMQTYQNMLTADLQKYRVFHRALFHHGVFEAAMARVAQLS